MRVIADTNVLVRVVAQDDPEQAKIAENLLREAELIAVPLVCLCELVWVLRSTFHFRRERIADAIDALLDADNLTVDRPAVDAGLATLRGGGDFADGVLAHEGSWLGGEVFVSFDSKAVELIERQGQSVQLLR